MLAIEITLKGCYFANKSRHHVYIKVAKDINYNVVYNILAKRNRLETPEAKGLTKDKGNTWWWFRLVILVRGSD